MDNETRQAPKLGEVLLAHGIVNADQLAVALAEQQKTGRPLGEIIVELGYAPGPIVAQALATQRGGMVKTEYGYATGFTAVAQAPPAPPKPSGDPKDETIAELRRIIVSREAEIERLQDLIGQLRSQCVDAAKAKTKLAEMEAEMRRLRAAIAV
jgi:uncharacterized protein involved in exopolysaccharide biosynthesis